MHDICLHLNIFLNYIILLQVYFDRESVPFFFKKFKALLNHVNFGRHNYKIIYICKTYPDNTVK
jgi:hypothetical protein